MDNRRFKKAEDYYQRGCYTEALSIFSALNQIDESNDCLNYMGCCNLYLGNYQIAKSLLEYLSQKKPDWDRPIFNLGRVYSKLGNQVMALNCFEKAIKINPDSEDGYFYLGTYYFQANDYNTAKNILRSL